ncbi:MAG: response regulator [Akkermansiaceae bacterium]|nr:response regulator [Armatimonadota bacterium]
MVSDEAPGSPPAARILVVDDEPAIVRLMEYVLDRQGYAVRTAADGEQALRVVAEFRPELILLDVMMPRKDGYTVAEAIRADPDLAGTPIIMLSAKAQDTDVEQGLAAGANLYLTKPFEPDGLLETVAKCLAESRSNGT